MLIKESWVKMYWKCVSQVESLSIIILNAVKGGEVVAFFSVSEQEHSTTIKIKWN